MLQFLAQWRLLFVLPYQHWLFVFFLFRYSSRARASHRILNGFFFRLLRDNTTIRQYEAALAKSLEFLREAMTLTSILPNHIAATTDDCFLFAPEADGSDTQTQVSDARMQGHPLAILDKLLAGNFRPTADCPAEGFWAVLRVLPSTTIMPSPQGTLPSRREKFAP